MRDDFVIFIITHGRPYNQKTWLTLQRLNCRYPIYFILDNQDDTVQDYIDRYGANNILIFDKNSYISSTDTGLYTPMSKFAVYARNAVEDIAEELGYKYFLMLDDDITKIRIRYNSNNSLKSFVPVDIFDDILYNCIEYLETADIACLSFGFCNSYRSGVAVLEKESSRQRFCAGGVFMRNTKYKVNWRLNMTEDLITSLDCGIAGQVWLQFLSIQVEVMMSEGSVDGGNSDTYRSFGRYGVMFFPTIAHPSISRPRVVNNHWTTTTVSDVSVPKIISERYRKGVIYEIV